VIYEIIFRSHDIKTTNRCIMEHEREFRGLSDQPVSLDIMYEDSSPTGAGKNRNMKKNSKKAWGIKIAGISSLIGPFSSQQAARKGAKQLIASCQHPRLVDKNRLSVVEGPTPGKDDLLFGIKMPHHTSLDGPISQAQAEDMTRRHLLKKGWEIVKETWMDNFVVRFKTEQGYVDTWPVKINGKWVEQSAVFDP